MVKRFRNFNDCFRFISCYNFYKKNNPVRPDLWPRNSSTNIFDTFTERSRCDLWTLWVAFPKISAGHIQVMQQSWSGFLGLIPTFLFSISVLNSRIDGISMIRQLHCRQRPL